MNLLDYTKKIYKVPLKIQNVLICQQGVERTNNCLASSCGFIVINIFSNTFKLPGLHKLANVTCRIQQSFQFFLFPLLYVNCVPQFILNPWSTNQAYRRLCKWSHANNQKHKESLQCLFFFSSTDKCSCICSFLKQVENDVQTSSHLYATTNAVLKKSI